MAQMTGTSLKAGMCAEGRSGGQGWEAGPGWRRRNGGLVLQLYTAPARDLDRVSLENINDAMFQCGSGSTDSEDRVHFRLSWTK